MLPKSDKYIVLPAATGRISRRVTWFILFACLWPGVATAQATAQNGASDAGPARKYERLMDDGIRNNGLGRYRVAEDAFRGALEVCEDRFGHNRAECGDVLIRLAMEISNQGRLVEAELVFKRARRLIRHSRSPLEMPRYLTYRALHAANKGRYKAAFKLVLDANQRRKTLLKSGVSGARAADPVSRRQLEQTLVDLAHGLFTQASIATAMGKLDQAKVTAHLARRLITRIDGAPDWWVAFVDQLLADIDRRQGNHRSAERRLRLALKTKQLALGNTRPVALTRFALGAVHHQRRRNPEVLDTMRPGLAIVLGELDRAPGVRYEQIVPFLMAAHAEAARNPDRRRALYGEMFGASQLARGNGISRTIAMVAARFSSDDPKIAALTLAAQQMARRRDRLRLELGRAAIRFGGRVQRERLLRLRLAYAQAARRTTALKRKLNEAFPDYATFVTSLPVPESELRPLIRPDEALVRFVIGDRASFVFLYRGGELHVERLAITRKRLDKAVRRLRAPFEKAGSRIPAFDVKASRKLYRDLFASIEARLKGVRHLVAVSSGSLLSLPFSLLVTKVPPRRAADDYRKVGWFAHRMAVSVMPSVRAFTALRGAAKSSAAALPFIGFGAPALAGRRGDGGMKALARHCQMGKPVPPRLVRKLAALPKTATELRQVARALGADRDSVHVAGAATEQGLRAQALEKYRIIYFATHGLLPGELRCQSEPALVLTPPRKPAASRDGDGVLDASEIAGLHLDADLVVLSACNTGGSGSREFGGEALSGLTRAFFQAGARSMIVSHWQVDSTATARLMTRLFGRVKDRPGQYAEALRGAQLDMIARKSTAHPFFWAAFTFVGSGRLRPMS